VIRPQLTLRARLTLLYTGLFTLCGAVIVAVSYILVGRLRTQGQAAGAQPPAGSLATFAARCRSQELSARPNPHVLVKCAAYFQQVGAQGQRDFTLSHLLQYSLLTVAVVIALAAALGWVFSGRALRPVHQVTAAARAASWHNLSARIAPAGPRDELRELAETFDEMLGRLQAAFESQQRFIANASHELRTPLAVMHATVDVVLDNPDATPDDLRGMASDISAAVDHAENLIGALLMLARNERGLTVREETDLATAAEDVLDTAALGDRRVHATLEAAPISGDPVLAERLVANLVDNAIRYNLPGGDIWVSTRAIVGGSLLTVSNTGPVISAQDARRIFQPFQRLHNRVSQEGCGLGLAIVDSIAAIHGATIDARPNPAGGLAIDITFPPATGDPDVVIGQWNGSQHEHGRQA
jgi:signal transduction histidine kinase